MFKLLSLYSDSDTGPETSSPFVGHVEFLRRETPAFIPPDRWPSDSVDLNPIDYCIWGRVQHHVYQKPVKDVDLTEAAPDRGLVWPAVDRCR